MRFLFYIKLWIKQVYTLAQGHCFHIFGLYMGDYLPYESWIITKFSSIDILPIGSRV
jgi:hypothetical protein